MQVIISHVNTDFDALASLLAAKKLYPEATIALSDKQNAQVRRFLNIYRDTLSFERDRNIDWSEVTELIIVDVASLQRIGNFTDKLQLDRLKIIVYDHHPPTKHNVEADVSVIEQVGAAVTLLVEEIKRRGIPISEFEATIFGLGLYTDTGNFTYNTTTPRDLQVASYLMECGMNLEMIQRFAEESLTSEQQALLDKLFVKTKTIEIDGLEIMFATEQLEEFQGGLAVITQKLLEMKGADAMVSVVKMKHHVYIVGRANADRINLQPLLKTFGGGGHQHAGSATVRRGDFQGVKGQVEERLSSMLQPAVTARDLMASPVKTLSPETTIEDAGHLMYRYGHSGYPIVDNDTLVGIITRRDLDKANHHGLGHAPVKAYMTTNIIDIHPETTLEEIQQIVIDHNVGRLPVVENGSIIGIVTRTNIIEKIHEQTISFEEDRPIDELKDNIQSEMQEQLPEEIYTILQEVSKIATKLNVNVYLIGGIVRDILLEKQNDDVDIVVEGDGILLAKELHKHYGGKLTTHESFGTATWTHPSSLEIDIASSRLEYYDRPASLPDVEGSTLKEDLYRRDFTINAMGVCLNIERFGELVDPFSGQLDLHNKTIKILHNLSFVEDPTRILRATRFETRFQFTMDEQTENLALHSIEQMKDVSANRIIDEIKRMFEEEDILLAMGRLYELKFWQQYTVDELSKAESLQHIKKLMELFKGHENEIYKTEQWFTYFCVPFFVSNQLESVEPFVLTKENRKFTEEIKQLKNKTMLTDTTLGSLHRTLHTFSDEAILFVAASDKMKETDLIVNYVRKRRNLKVFLTGNDLKEYGLRPGPAFKDILHALEVATLQGEVTSKETATLWLEQYIANMKE